MVARIIIQQLGSARCAHRLILEVFGFIPRRGLFRGSAYRGRDIATQAKAVEFVVVKSGVGLRDQPIEVDTLTAKVNQDLKRYATIGRCTRLRG
jgi:hypothetical protein